MPTSLEEPTRARQASEAAESSELHALINRVAPYVDRVVRPRAKHPHLVDELRQDGRVAVWQAFLRFDPSKGSSLDSFARVYARTSIKGAVRRQAVHEKRFRSLEHAAKAVDGESTEQLIDRAILASPAVEEFLVPAEAFDADDLAPPVRTFLAQLSPELRDTVQDVILDGLSQAEAARKRGVTRMAITKRMQRIVRLGRASADLRVLRNAA